MSKATCIYDKKLHSAAVGGTPEQNTQILHCAALKSLGVS